MYYSNFKTIYRKVAINVVEAMIHGGVIIGAVLLTLPQVRIKNGRLLPVEALHMSVFMLLVAVSTSRYIFQSYITKLRFLFLTLKSVCVFALSLLVTSLVSSDFSRVSTQIFTLFSTYDSCTMLINTLLFCMAISFFI